jgi:hypothetical protein
MPKRYLAILAILSFALGSRSQAQITSLIVQFDLGVGGGLSFPTSTLADNDNIGYNAVAKARLHGILPLNITAMGMFNTLPNKAGGNSDQQWLVGAGLEYGLTSVAVHPYFSVDAYYSDFTNSASGSPTLSRGGMGFGFGAILGLPGSGGIDGSLKYQVMNMWGKEANEESATQVSVTVAYMFNIF